MRPGGQAQLWPFRYQCPTAHSGGVGWQAHWDPSCGLSWTLELPRELGAARSALGRAEMSLSIARRVSQGLMGVGVAGTVGWTELGGWASVQVMPVTPGPAPPAALCLYPPAHSPACSLSLGFNPQSLWTGVGQHVGQLSPLDSHHLPALSPHCTFWLTLQGSFKTGSHVSPRDPVNSLKDCFLASWGSPPGCRTERRSQA